MSIALKERRKRQRQKLPKLLTVYDCATNEPIGGLVNLSSDGAMFITPGPVKASTSWQCRVPLTRQILGHDEIIFEVECRWCRRNAREDRWESGYKLEVSGVNEQLISYLTLSLKLGDWGDASLHDVATVEMENRRRAPRYELMEPLPVYQQRRYRPIGTVANLSTQGAGLITPRPIDKDDLIHCRVMLPKKVFQYDCLLFDARCQWCRLDRGDGLYRSGHIIVNISEKDTAIILHLLIHHARVQPTEKRIRVAR